MWTAIASVLIGVAATFVADHIYFRRSLRKALTPYVQFSSSPMSRMNAKVRAELDVSFRGQPVCNLYEVQFLIANTGATPIRDIIEPLSILIPDGCTLLDANVVYISPTGRKISLYALPEKNKVNFDIHVLNGGEFFIVKLVINGDPDLSSFVFEIVADGLPPTLELQWLPFGSIRAQGKKQKMNFESFLRIIFVPVIISFPIFLSAVYTIELSYYEEVEQRSWLILLLALSASLLCTFILYYTPIKRYLFSRLFEVPEDVMR